MLPVDFLLQTRGSVSETLFKGKFNRDQPSETNRRCGREVEDEHPAFVWGKEASPHEE